MKVDVKPTTPRLTADDDRHDAAPADVSDLERWVDEGGSLEPLTARDASTAFPTSNQETSSKSANRGIYHCQCGHELRVLGGGRHRIYFPVGDARLDNPIMNRACPACNRALPGKNPY